ncbi:hypothetical protein GCM10027289_21990 [Tsukamurella serpentis]
MVLTLVPLLALCLLALFASGNFRLGFGGDPKDETVAAIDAKSVFEITAGRLDFPVRMPSGPGVADGVPEGWKATATRDEAVTGGVVFSVNYLTPEKNAIELAQSGGQLAEVVQSVFGTRSRPSGEIEVDGRTWQVYGPNDKNRSAWALQLDREVIVIYGSATVPRFTELATAVQSQQPLPRAAGDLPTPASAAPSETGAPR